MEQFAGGFRRRFETSFMRLAEEDTARGWRLGTVWLLGCLALGITTAVCYRLGLTLSAPAFLFLIIVILLSLKASMVTALAFSVISVILLFLFFVKPRFSLEMADPQDLWRLAYFFVALLVVTGLVTRLRGLASGRREQAQLLNLTSDAIFVLDLDRTITYWNRGAEDLYGWKAEEAISKRIQDLLGTNFPVSRDESTQTLLRTGHWEGELTQTRRDGSPVIVASRWSLQRESDGRPSGVLEINTDITERKQAEEALSRSQAALLAEAQKLSATGSFGWNPLSGELTWTDESFRIFGFDPRTTPLVEDVLKRVHPDDLALVREVMERATKEKQDFDLEHRLLMPDGSVKHIHIVAHLMIDEPGTLQFVGAVMDVTAAKLAQERLQQAQADLAYVTRVTTLGEITASIAHGVNQPLAAITTDGQAALRFLDHSPPNLDEVRGCLRRMIGDGRRAGEVVQHIRALTKKSVPEPIRLGLNAVIRDGTFLLQRELTTQRVVFRPELARGLPDILGDRVQLQQVVINLVINAIQAMATVNDRPRELVIRSSQDGAGQVVVSVRDSGVGIDPANADRLFDAFFTTKPNGMGMGLSVCHTIIEAHGGRIWASGDSGPGATFLFSLPSIRESSP
jgi:PAS domain S-box-containing protein